MKNPDDKLVTVGYESSRNITFQEEGEEIGYTWGQWRKMTPKQQADALTEYLFSIVDVYVEDEET